MDIVTRFTTPGIVYLLTLAFGYWLSRSGRPYHGLLFNAHKLIALSAVVVTAIQIYKLLGHAQIQAILIALIVLSSLCIGSLFVSGALMSMGKPGYHILKLVHSITPFLALVFMAVMIYLLVGRSS